MGADNWAVCPACMTNEQKDVRELEKAVREAYGKVDVDVFDDMRAELQRREDELNGWEGNSKHATFRENYEIYGAEEGTIHISYRGHCTKCDAGTDFTTDTTFWPEEK